MDQSFDSKPFGKTNSDLKCSKETFHSNRSTTAGDTDLIDVDDIELSDEESWLYKLPKAAPTGRAYKWLQKNAEVSQYADTTKDALVNKLKELSLCKSDTVKQEGSQTIKNQQPADLTEKMQPKTSEAILCSQKNKENQVLDVSDVLKIARLQEENLQMSACKLLLGRKTSSNGDFPALNNTMLGKPTSEQSLGMCNGKEEHKVISPISPVQKLIKQEFFHSSSILNNDSETYHGSLPNIRGYNSLKRPKKSQKMVEERTSSPRPIQNMKVQLNGAYGHVYDSSNGLDSALGECRTLPSSYRHRSNSTSRKEGLIQPPSHRRDSSPFQQGFRNNLNFTLPRRDSAPTMNPPKYLSPVSSPVSFKRHNSLASPANSPKRVPTPAKRLPLTTVYNQPSKQSFSPVPLRKETATKIPGYTPKSGIPVPSSAATVSNKDDDSWSQDCF